jgi:hypothetical protein
VLAQPCCCRKPQQEVAVRRGSHPGDTMLPSALWRVYTSGGLSLLTERRTETWAGATALATGAATKPAVTKPSFVRAAAEENSREGGGGGAGR